ncbi:MAG: DEAD/DEAH box helicase [Dissulfurispiraceae bacterium]|nr:DEAD/DEAH box helicase [Dissulfurispiraceae bacterium]
MSFEKFGLSGHIMSSIRELGYTEPTPIQQQSIPHILQGRDIMGLAQTGTGKTAAFALPILQSLAGGAKGSIRALIIAPTRELAEQINDSFRALGKRTGLRSATVYGGVGINPQIQKLRKGVEIVVACPGRLLDHISQGTINLSALEVLVLDEADRMFDMGFLPDIRKIINHIPAERQTLLFSATMPQDIRGLANDILSDPVNVEVSVAAAVETVTHALFPVPRHLKTALLLEMLKTTGSGSVLIFTKTKHRAKRLDMQLAAAGYKAASLQGNLSQSRRQSAINGFRDGSFQILVATDIAARGIDISTISHVINYDIPDTVEAYTHRIGRTGRAQKTGDAFTLIESSDELMVSTLERAMGERIERRRLEGFDYNKPLSADMEFLSGTKPTKRPRKAQGSGRPKQGHNKNEQTPNHKKGSRRRSSSGPSGSRGRTGTVRG